MSRQKAVAKGGALSQDLQLLLDRLQSLDNERKVINKKLFGADGPDQVSHVTITSLICQVLAVYYLQ